MNGHKPVQQTSQPRYTRLSRSIGKWVAILLLGLFITVMACGYWLLATPTGFQRLLASAEQISGGAIQTDGVSGTIQSLQIKKLQFQRENLRLIVHRLRFGWEPAALLSKILKISEMSAHKMDVYTVERPEEETTERTTLPDSLALPIDLLIENFKIGEVAIYTSESIKDHDDRQSTNIFSNIALNVESNTKSYQIKHLAVDSEYGSVMVSGQISTAQPFDLNTQLKLDSSQWGITKASLTGDLKNIAIDLEHQHRDSHGSVQAQLHPYAEKQMVSALKVVMNQLNIADYSKDTMQTNLSLQSTLNKNNAGQLVGNLSLKNHVVKTLDQNGLPFSSVNTNVLITDEMVELQGLNLGLPQNGLISGILAWHLYQSNGSAALKISQLNPAVIDKRVQALKVNGRINAKGGLQDQAVSMHLTGDDLNLQANVTNKANTIALEKLILQHNHSRLTGQGELSLENEQAVHFEGQLEKFNLADFVKMPASNLNSKIALNGKLSPKASGTLRYLFKDSHINQQPVTGDGTLSFQQPTHLDGDAKLQLGLNKLSIKGRFGRPGDALNVRVSAPNISQIGFGLAGKLQTQLQLRGTVHAPELEFDVNSQKLILPGEQSVDSIIAKGQYIKDVLSFALTLKDYQQEKETKLQKLELNVSGKQSGHTIQTKLLVKDNLEVVLQANGKLHHKAAADKPSWNGQINQLTVSGDVPVHLEAPATLLLSEDKAKLGKTQLTVAGGAVDIAHANWTPKIWDTQGRFNNIALHYGQEAIAKEDILHLGGQWALSSRNLLSGKINIAREKGDWYLSGENPLPIGLQDFSLDLQAENQQVYGQFNFLSQEIGKASARVALPLLRSDNALPFSPQAPINGDLALDVSDLSVANQLVGGMFRVAGALEVNTKISGTLDAPLLEGNITGNNLALSLIDQGLDLQKGELSAELNQSAIKITRFNFTSPFMPPPEDLLLDQVKLDNKPGELNIVGTIDFADSKHHIKTTLERISLLSPNQYWIVVSGNLGMQLSGDTLGLDGKIIADAGLITQPPASQPKLADDIVFVSDKESDESTSQLMNLNILLDLGKQFFIRASGLQGRLDGNLRLTSSETEALKATGSIAARHTTFEAYGQDLKVVRGMVNFYGPLDDPGLNVLAIREGLEVEAGVKVTGTVRRPQVDLVSTPTVPDMAKLSWIVLGRAPDSGGVDTSLLIAAASSIFGGEAGFTGKIRDALGVDEFSLKQGSSSGGSPLASQIGVIGKRLSSNLYLSYERGVTSTTAGVAKLTYKWTPHISIVTQAGDDSAGDIFYTFKFD